MEVFYYILVIISFAILLLTKGANKQLKLFIPLLLLTLIVEGARFILSKDNLVAVSLFSIYTPTEYLLLSLFAASIIKPSYKRTIIYFSIPFFVIISLVLQFKVDSPNYFYKYLDVLIEAPLMLMWSLFYIFQLFTDEETFHFKSNPFFWISVGNLLFFAGSFFSYGFGSYLHNMEQYKLADAIFWIARILNIVLYIFYNIGFLCFYSLQKRSYLL